MSTQDANLQQGTVCACLLILTQIPAMSTVSNCALSILYVSIIRAKPLDIMNSFRESSAIIHFTLLLLSLHSS